MGRPPTVARRRARALAAGALGAAVAAAAVAALASPSTADDRTPGARDLASRARALHRDAVVVGARVGVPDQLSRRWADLAVRGATDHFDLPRAAEGGLTAPVFAIDVAPSYATGGAARRALELIDLTRRAVDAHPKRMVLAATPGDIRAAKQSGKLAVLMGLEGGHAIEDSLPVLRELYRAGVRSMSLTHSATHRWADSVGPVLDADYDPPRYAVHGGLAPFGREVVREMNRLGMIVDLSHASEATIDDVLEATRAPVMAARSGCRALVDLPRNLTDRQIKRIAAGGGIVMIHFGSASLDREVWGWVKATGQRLRPESARLRERHARDPAALAAATRALWAKAGPPPRAPWTRVVDHVEHVIRIAGDDAVGLGAGFEGVASAPVGLEDVSLLPRITEELLRRGHSEARVRKVLGEGFLAFFARVEAARAKLATEAPSAAAYRK